MRMGRFLFWEIEMNRFLSAVLGVVIVVGSALAFDPPRIIGVLHGRANSQHFGDDYCNVGDWNGDGCDELLFSDEPFIPGDGDSVDNLNQVELYYGSQNGLNDSATVLFEEHDHIWELGYSLNFVGHMTGDQSSIFGVSYLRWPPQGGTWPTTCMVQLFNGSENFNAQPVFHIQNDYRPGIFLPKGYNSRPTDLNGDGRNDLIALYGPSNRQDNFSVIEAFFGGDTVDTAPDWRVGVPSANGAHEWATVSSGRDINGDGYDDILLSLMVPGGSYGIYLFLGGDPMPTEPLFHFTYDHFEGKLLTGNCALLGDVNRDGYDDWAVFWITRGDANGYYVFFGGAHPDSVPDLTLQGYSFMGGSEGLVVGGDFNGDGVQDIVTGSKGGDHDYGVVHIFFGSRSMTGRPDISVNGINDYGREYQSIGAQLGAVGDYNGDGADDFVSLCGTEVHRNFVVFGGNRNWRLEAPRPKPEPPADIHLMISPNPFNATATVHYHSERPSHMKIEIFDLSGRMIKELWNGDLPIGDGEFVWTPTDIAAGIYLLRAESGHIAQHSNRIQKLIYMP